MLMPNHDEIKYVTNFFKKILGELKFNLYRSDHVHKLLKIKLFIIEIKIASAIVRFNPTSI